MSGPPDWIDAEVENIFAACRCGPALKCSDCGACHRCPAQRAGDALAAARAEGARAALEEAAQHFTGRIQRGIEVPQWAIDWLRAQARPAGVADAEALQRRVLRRERKRC